jgi:hypothetical protein
MFQKDVLKVGEQGSEFVRLQAGEGTKARRLVGNILIP